MPETNRGKVGVFPQLVDEREGDEWMDRSKWEEDETECKSEFLDLDLSGDANTRTEASGQPEEDPDAGEETRGRVLTVALAAALAIISFC